MATSRLRAWALALGALLGAGCATPSASTRDGEPALLLTDAAGQPVRFDSLWQGQEATVVVFWSLGCPCVRRYQERVDALLGAWPSRRVRVVAVASNAGEPLDELLRVAKERGVRVPLYRDEGGRVAQALGARSTPSVAVLDGAGRVRFLGWMDNERLPGEADRQPYVERAVGGLLAGAAFAARSPVFGCTITRSLFTATPATCGAHDPSP